LRGKLSEVLRIGGSVVYFEEWPPSFGGFHHVGGAAIGLLVLRGHDDDGPKKIDRKETKKGL
jgi:hypothetical protein